MIITQVSQLPNLPNILNYFPNQFKTEKEKKDPVWIKNTLDYFAHIAFLQYRHNRDTFARNYDLLKGIISWKDFYYDREDTVASDFMGTLLESHPLPAHIKHYPIMNRPINTMVGELSKRPDNHRVRAFDDESRAQELEWKTDLVQQLILQQARQQILQEQGGEGKELSGDDLEKLSVEKVQDYLTDYTSLAERWGNHTLTCLKAELSMKDKGEDAFRDLLASSREFFHVYEDNSKRGMDVEVANTKNVIHSPTNDRKYSKDWYYGGLLRVMEISEIMEKVPGLTKEEIDHMVVQMQNPNFLTPTDSNLFSSATGPDTIKYDTYHRLLEQERQFLAAELEDGSNNDQNQSGLFNNVSNTNPLSYKFSVLQMYWISKKLVGKLEYLDEGGNVQITLVDESYQEGTPGELSIEWGWVNQWYMGVRLGTEIYIIKPLNLLDYCPIIGVTHEVKNTQARSLVDLLKSFQSIYNVCLNQLWELLEKEKGNVGVINIRRIPIAKEGDQQDAIADWEAECEQRGIIFEDDSPENTRTPSTNTNLSRSIDLTRTKEIESRIRLAEWVKKEAMELVGMSEQRMGGVTATETATGTQTALTQSFAQTEPYFAQHEYVMDMVYQALLDAAQWVESTKEVSTLSYITGEGENAFIQVTAPDIRLKDLHVFSTSRSEDLQLFTEIRALSQPMLQNGASPYEIIELYSTNSIRQMKSIFKKLKDQQDNFIQGKQQQEAQLEQGKQQLEQQTLEQQAEFHADEVQMEKYKTDVQAATQVEVAQMKNYFQSPALDTDQNGIPDPLDIAAHHLAVQEHYAKTDLERQKLSQDMQKHLDEQRSKTEDRKVEREKIQAEKQRTAEELKVKKMQARKKPKK